MDKIDADLETMSTRGLAMVINEEMRSLYRMKDSRREPLLIDCGRSEGDATGDAINLGLAKIAHNLRRL